MSTSRSLRVLVMAAISMCVAVGCGEIGAGSGSDRPDLCAGCDAARSTDEGAVDGAASDGGAPLFARCMVADDCASRLCHFYPARGESLCTRPCSTGADCPPPSPGCNMMGVCRIQ